MRKDSLTDTHKTQLREGPQKMRRLGTVSYKILEGLHIFNGTKIPDTMGNKHKKNTKKPQNNHLRMDSSRSH